MGGQSSLKGYLIQTIIGTLKALSNNPNWTSISLEPNDKSEKVDLMLSSSKEKWVYQIKSSKNLFYRNKVKKWASELKESNDANYYEIVLIGDIHPKLAKEKIMNEVKIENPFKLDIPKMMKVAANLLKPFLNDYGIKNPSNSFCIEAVRGLNHKFLEFSTEGKLITRLEFEDQIRSWVKIIEAEFIPNPFTPLDKYFERFLDPSRVFNHCSILVGRVEHLEIISEFIKSDRKILILFGFGGMGKSKILYEGFNRFKELKSILFLHTNEKEIKREQYKYANPNSIIIVDDCHLRAQYEDLFRLIDAQKDLKMVFSLRTQGLDFLKREIHNFNFETKDYVILPEVGELSINQKRELITNIHPNAADDDVIYLCQFAKESTFILVLSALFLKDRHIYPSQITTETDFKSLILARFLKIGLLPLYKDKKISFDQEKIEYFLFLVSAIEPFYFTNSDLVSKIAQDLDISDRLLVSLIDQLKNVGILYRKGNLLRISPDILSDYLLEKTLQSKLLKNLNFPGLLTTYSEYEINILKNIARVEFYYKIKGVEKEYLSPIIEKWKNDFIQLDLLQKMNLLEKISKITTFRPEIGLYFVKMCLYSNNSNQSDQNEKYIYLSYQDLLKRCSQILEKITYFDFIEEVVPLLWNLGQLLPEKHFMHFFQHPFGIIEQMIKYDFGKSFNYNQKNFQILREILLIEKNPESIEKGLEIVQHLLSRSGESFRMVSPNEVSILPFNIPKEKTQNLRNEVLDFLSSMLSNQNLRVKLKIIRILASSLGNVFPRQENVNFEEINSQWVDERRKIVNIIIDSYDESDPLIQFEIYRNLQWVLQEPNFPEREKLLINEKIIKRESNLDFKLIQALNGFIPNWDRRNHNWEQKEQKIKHISCEVIQEFKEQKHDLSSQMQYLDNIVKKLNSIRDSDLKIPKFDIFIDSFAGLSQNSLAIIIKDFIKNKYPNLISYLHIFLKHLRKVNLYQFNIKKFQILQTNNFLLINQLAKSYQYISQELDTNDEKILLKILKLGNSDIKITILEILLRIRNTKKKMFKNIIDKIQFDESDNDECYKEYALVLFDKNFLQSLSSKMLKVYLLKFSNLENLDDDKYVINEFIAFCLIKIPDDALRFIFNRFKKPRRSNHYQSFPYSSSKLRVYGNLENAKFILPKIQKKALFYFRFFNILKKLFDCKLFNDSNKNHKGKIWNLFESYFLKMDRILRNFSNLYAIISNDGDHLEALNVMGDWLLSKNTLKFFTICRLMGKFKGIFVINHHKWIADIVKILKRRKENLSEFYLECLKSISYTILNSSGRYHGIPDGSHSQLMNKTKQIAQLYEKTHNFTMNQFFLTISKQANRNIEGDLISDEEKEI